MISKNVLVTGGAGFIGSHTVKALVKHGYFVVSYDDLRSGNKWALKYGTFVLGDIGDTELLCQTISDYQIGSVIHFAASAYVAESMLNPNLYYMNNVSNSLSLLNAITRTGVRHIVFSSSCAIYGEPTEHPIQENTPTNPMSPYGETKLVIERSLKWFSQAHSFTWVALRYFNAAGADLDGELGEVHLPETHLVPLVLDASLFGKAIVILGDDYPTFDGTCIRDYVHVVDLADAHTRALEYLICGGEKVALNLGTSIGHSVREVIACASKITGRVIESSIATKRPGDPSILIANASRAYNTLGWKPINSRLDDIVQSAWSWHQKRQYFE